MVEVTLLYRPGRSSVCDIIGEPFFLRPTDIGGAGMCVPLFFLLCVLPFHHPGSTRAYGGRAVLVGRGEGEGQRQPF